MKKLSIKFLCLACLALFAACSNDDDFNEEQGGNKAEKVILDTDMVETFDDGVAMMMLQKASNVDLLGVVTVTGNTWSKEGAAYAVRQQEATGMKTPIYLGERMPEDRKAGYSYEQLLEEHNAAAGDIESAVYLGAVMKPEPTTWQNYYKQMYNREPEVGVESKNGVDFIIEQVNKYPGEITIAAIGPCSNLAKALEKEPSIAYKIKRLIVMGGAFFVPGLDLLYSELNIWIAPEAAQKTFRGIPNITFVSLDVCNDVPMMKSNYDMITSSLTNPVLSEMWARNHVTSAFKANPDHTWYVWDAIVSAIIIDPSILKATQSWYVDVNTTPGTHYGQTLAYKEGEQPEGTRKQSIVTQIDNDKFWKLVYSSLASF